SDNNFLFYKYALKKRGYDVIYTGGILPASEVIEIFKVKPFEYLIVNSNAFDFTRKKTGYFNNIGKSLMIKKIILTDSPSGNEEIHHERLINTSDPAEFLKYIDGLR
ncbi:MAG: merR-type protein, partial [Bacteroidota bacterium]|nr:merR-type protein [Bacteroidota bacterium]